MSTTRASATTQRVVLLPERDKPYYHLLDDRAATPHGVPLCAPQTDAATTTVHRAWVDCAARAICPHCLEVADG